MTIHKAKGLEFGTVIVPGLDSGPVVATQICCCSTNGCSPDKGKRAPASGGLLLAPIKATGEETHPTYRYLRDLNAEAEDVESSRLLYVAATRAENRLHLMACLGCDKDGELKKPIARSLLSRAWPVAEGSFQRRSERRPRKRNRARVEEIYSVNRLARGFRVPSLPDALCAGRRRRKDARKSEIEFSWAGETARHVGTVVHQWLQRIADDEMRGWDARRVDALRQTFSRELERRGIQRSRARTAAALVAERAEERPCRSERHAGCLGLTRKRAASIDCACEATDGVPHLRNRSPFPGRHRATMDRGFQDQPT